MQSTFHPESNKSASGSALLVVIGFVLLCGAAAASVLYIVGNRMSIAHRRVNMEQAFYIAEAGLERAAQYVAAGNDSSTILRGNLGDGGYETHITFTHGGGGAVAVSVVSTGTVNNVSRGVKVRGLRNVSWARYAFWYDREALQLVFAAGDTFRGRVYARPLMRFSNQNINTYGQAHFYERAWTHQAGIQRDSGADPKFDQGLVLNADLQEMTTADLDKLRAEAGSNLIPGDATVVIDGNQLKITCASQGWNNKVFPIEGDTVFYAHAHKYTTGTGRNQKTVSEKGNITVSAPDGLDGRLTLVSDADINIVNHVRYKKNPRTNPDSNDALGLIAKEHVKVQTSAPSNLEIYAHILCGFGGRSGGFGVVDYDKGNARGKLLVYGGIANLERNAVGTTAANKLTGFIKDYQYDPRFLNNPPPHYPKLEDELEWEGWEG